jgi:2-polyprenyl-3-methyl-5-hydroxy-6-metoxy-1,4-benzoquinol methylase
MVASKEYTSEYFLTRKLLWKGKPDSSVSTAIRFLNPTATDKILDLGCGLGQISALIANSGSTVTGVDFSEYAIDKARKLWGQKVRNNLQFLRKDVTLEEIPGEYDKILCHHMLEHVERDQAIKIIRKIFRALKQSGVFVLGIPINDQIAFKRLAFQFARAVGASQLALKIFEPTHLASYSIDQIQNILKREGFVIGNTRHFSYARIEFPQPLYSVPFLGKYFVSGTVIKCLKK